ncbi:transglycosylase family protein [Pseudonocardia sp. NPDC049635]|uniref:transglycosylase family protein n=1 Tax=Pseudonocardia sp. NPDC049635 TaxID=3155506 RepID=UPI00340E0DB2
MDTWWERHRPASVLGTVLLVVGALTGAQMAVGAVADPGSGEDRARSALSPYSDGAFTVRAASVDRRVDIATAEDGSYVLGHTPAGSDVVLDLDLIEGEAARPWWVEPVSGRTIELGTLESAGVARFPVPDGGGAAWVLVVDDAAAGYPMPDAEAIAEFVADAVHAATGADPGTAGVGSGDATPASGEERPWEARPDRPDGDGADSGNGSGGSGSGGGAGSEDGSGGSGSGGGAGSAGEADPGNAAHRGAEERAARAGDAPASGRDPDDREFRAGGPAGEPDERRDDRSGSGSDHSGPGAGAAPEPGHRDGAGHTESPERREPPTSPQPPGSQEPAEPQRQDPPRPDATAESTWDRLAQCESSGDWSISTGNGYYGGLQFDRPTWSEFGGTAYAPTADGATREQQIEIATKVRDARGGYGSWPACSRKLGLPR